MKYSSLLLSLTLCAGVAQAGVKKHIATKDTVEKVLLDTIHVSAKAGKPPYQPSTTKAWDISNTKVALSFNWKEKTANAREVITMHPYCYATDSVVLDAKSMRIDTVGIMTGAGIKRLPFSYKNDELTIRFDHPYTAKDSVMVYLKYTAMPYAQQTGGSMAITDDRGLYFINTDNKVPHKPSQIWTQGETQSNSHWMVTLDKPNTRFTTQIELTVPDTMTTLSNGGMVSQTAAGNGMRTDVWRMDMPIQAYAVMFAIGKFSIVKNTWQGKEVNYYVEPEYAQYGNLMFNNTSEMMSYYSDATGVPYPWNKYSQVVVRDYVSGAMENTSASLFGDFMNQTAREIADKNSEDVVSHELFHQWFGDYVTAESWSNITVNESFANYGEQLWRRHKYGNDYAAELGWSDLQTYIYTSAIKDPQLVRFNYDNREEVFDAISYNKGGAILHYLNTLIGDAAFNKAMNIYLTRNALHSAEAHNWRMAMEEATGQDWNWFFNQFYYHKGHPTLKVNYNYEDTANQLVVTVNQTQPDSLMDYTLPLKTMVIYGNEKTVIDWNIDHRRDTFTFAYKNGVKPIIIPDYLHVLPGDIKENKKAAQWLEQYKAGIDYVTRRLAIAGAGKQSSDSSSQVLLGLALQDELKSLRRFALNQFEAMQSDKYRKRWTPKLIEIAKTDKEKLVRAEAMDVLEKWKVAAAKDIMIAGVYDSSYMLAGSSLDALNTVAKDTAYVIAKQMATTNPRGALQASIWDVIGKQAKDDDAAYFERIAPYVQGSKKFALAFAMSSYMKHVEGDASFTKVANALGSITTLETMKSYRSTLGGILFQVAAEQKENSKSDNKKEAIVARKRLKIVKGVIKKVIAAEADKAQVEEYGKMMKDTFE